MNINDRLPVVSPIGNCGFFGKAFIWDIPFREPASSIMFNQLLLHHVGTTFSKMYSVAGNIEHNEISVNVESMVGSIISPNSELCVVSKVAPFINHYKSVIRFNDEVFPSEEEFGIFKEQVVTIFHNLLSQINSDTLSI